MFESILYQRSMYMPVSKMKCSRTKEGLQLFFLGSRFSCRKRFWGSFASHVLIYEYIHSSARRKTAKMLSWGHLPKGTIVRRPIVSDDDDRNELLAAAAQGRQRP